MRQAELRNIPPRASTVAHAGFRDDSAASIEGLQLDACLLFLLLIIAHVSRDSRGQAVFMLWKVRDGLRP